MKRELVPVFAKLAQGWRVEYRHPRRTLNLQSPAPMTKFFRLFFLLLFSVASVGLVSGTTVIPPTMDELVSQAELIFQGTVTDVQSRWEGEGANRHIETYVTFKVEDTVKGAPGNTYTLSMLVGTVGNETM